MASSTRTIELTDVGFPPLPEALCLPQIGAAEYSRRIDELVGRVHADAVVVYGDREHCGNLAFLCGFDPRFEEALLVVSDRRRHLLVGREGLDYAGVSPLDLEVTCVAGFSLMGIDRPAGQGLLEGLGAAGIGLGDRVAVVGWKYFEAGELELGRPAIAAPAFIVDALRAVVGESGAVLDAARALIDPDGGLRTINGADQIAICEWAASRCSARVFTALGAAREGVTERELAGHLWAGGDPLSLHPIVISGPDVRLALRSPTDRVLRHGDPIAVGMGLRGGNCTRAGMLASAGEGEPGEAYLQRLAIPYFRVLVSWWESVAIGIQGGELYERCWSVAREVGVAPKLNPGHLIDVEEWLSTPIRAGSREPLRSGMVLQADIIPDTAGEFGVINCEDTVALGDEELRAELAQRHPEAWARIEARREFARAQLGVEIGEELLPLSCGPAHLPPFWLSPEHALTAR